MTEKNNKNRRIKNNLIFCPYGNLDEYVFYTWIILGMLGEFGGCVVRAVDLTMKRGVCLTFSQDG